MKPNLRCFGTKETFLWNGGRVMTPATNAETLSLGFVVNPKCSTEVWAEEQPNLTI